MITNQEFKIDSRKEEFRVAKISPVDMLAITNHIDFENLKMTTELIKFSLENVEVKQGEKWVPVKTKDKEIYWPTNIEEDYIALQEIFTYMVKEVIAKVFTKSRE